MNDLQEINSVSDLLLLLAKQKDGIWWYRGHSDVSWTLLPGLMRAIPNLMEEQEILKRFKQSSHLLLEKTPKDSFDWLFWMQHYGVPTRLLDWSESPLASLYFAVEDASHKDKDGALWLLDPIALNKNSNIDAASEFYVPSFEDDWLKGYSPETFASENKTKLHPMAATATRTNPRIQAQLGVFTIFHRRDLPIDQVGDRTHALKFKIPAKSKPVIFQELLRLRIDRFTLFPEIASIGHNIRRTLGL